MSDIEVDEDTLQKALKQWNPNLYSPKFRFLEVHTPLSLAAKAGFTALAEDILARGFTKLLEVQDISYPVQRALARRKYGTAAFLLQNMPKKRYRSGPFTFEV